MVMSSKNLTYHKKLDKNKPIYLAWDNIFTGSQSPSAADTRVFNAFIAKLRNAGLNIVRTKQGPNQLYQNMNYLYKNCIKNAIIINCMNGVDPANIKEVPKFPESAYTNKVFCSNDALKSANVNGLKSGEAKAGAITRYNNNDVVLGWFRNAADCCNEGGRGVTRGIIDRTSNLAYQGRFYHPEQYMKQHEIIGLCSSSDEGTRAGDPEGLKLADLIIDLFKDGEDSEDDNSLNPDVPSDSTTPSDTDKTITKKVIKQIYKIPWYEKILTVKTDTNGAFLIPQPKDMTIKGEYLVNLYFAGDMTHEASTKSIRIQKFSGDVVNDELLESITKEYYSDGTSNETAHTGSVPDDNSIKTKTVTITYTYEGGVLKNTDIKTIENYKVIEPATETENISVINPIDTEINNTNPTNIKGADPFSNDMATLADGKPDVVNMATGGKGYVMYDDNRSYTLTSSQFQEVYYRDSKTLQLNNYNVSNYTAFQSTDTQTYNVISRMEWNPVVQAVHHWLVAHNGASWPSEIKIDFANQRVTINGKNIAFTGKQREYHVVTDHQDNTTTTYGTCGPTSASMTTQWFYNYVSEARIKRESGHGYGGVGPDGLVKALNKHNFVARKVSGFSNWKNAVTSGKAFVFHEYGHYCCVYNANNEATQVLFSNPGGSYGGLGSGWFNINTVNNKGIGGHVVPTLNWTISESERQRINHFFKSMGGAWNRPNNNGRLLPYVYNGG